MLKILKRNQRTGLECPSSVDQGRSMSKLIFLNCNSKTETSDLVQLRLHSPADTTVLQRNLETVRVTVSYMDGVVLFSGQQDILFFDNEGNILSFCRFCCVSGITYCPQGLLQLLDIIPVYIPRYRSGKTNMNSTQFRTRAAAMAFIEQQGIVLSCNSTQLALKEL